jgi:hypothetical protein
MLVFKKFKEIQSFVFPKKFVHYSKFIKKDKPINKNKEVKKIKEELQKYEKRPEEYKVFYC